MMQPSSVKFQSVVEVSSSEQRPVDLLAEVSGLSKNTIKRCLEKGAVWLGKMIATKFDEPTQIYSKPRRLRRAKSVLQVGDRLFLNYDAAVLASECPVAQLIADEGIYSIWYKPPGMLCQGSKWADHCTLNRWAEKHLEPQRPAFIVHRLDRMASGLVVLAHSKSAAAALSQQFSDRQVVKIYQVIVEGDFNDDKREIPYLLDDPLYEKPAVTHVLSSQPVKQWLNGLHQGVHHGLNTEEAVISAALVDYSGLSLLEVKIETGRKHQIRKHLADAGFPVVGDRLYGKAAYPVDLQLQARYLSLADPASGQIRTYELNAVVSC